jgi:3-oxoacyl-[acyl-carrier-protein] synthase II
VLGEGAVALVLERGDRARERGARAYAELAGSGITSNAVHITASDVDGQARAMRMAMEDGGLRPEDIGLVHAHATATPQGDVEEADAIAEAVGLHPAVSAIKSNTGHLLGASGALTALATVYGLRDGVAPAILNLREVDPAVKLDLVTGAARERGFGAALANSFGFGGHNVSLAFRRVD